MAPALQKRKVRDGGMFPGTMHFDCVHLVAYIFICVNLVSYRPVMNTSLSNRRKIGRLPIANISQSLTTSSVVCSFFIVRLHPSTCVRASFNDGTMVLFHGYGHCEMFCGNFWRRRLPGICNRKRERYFDSKGRQFFQPGGSFVHHQISSYRRFLFGRYWCRSKARKHIAIPGPG